MSLNYIVFDLETVPNDRAGQYYAKKQYSAPANYKDPDKIEAYIRDARHSDQQKAGLYWWTGQIICASFEPLNGPPTYTISSDDERYLITAIFDYLAGFLSPSLIGKNGDTFDIPYLRGRAMHHDVGIPPALRPYRSVSDINEIFGMGGHAIQRGHLADYAFGLNIGEKLGHGSEVANWYNQAILGDQSAWATIRNYCRQDVAITAEILRRYLKDYEPTVPRAILQERPLITDDSIPF